MPRAIVFVLCCSFGLSGCGVLQATRNWGEYFRDTYKADPVGPDDGIRDESLIDRDIEQTMLGARSASGVEGSVEPDKWWYDHVMSSEARSIERSLGVNYY